MVIQDRRVQGLMDELELPPDRANLFEIIDADGSGTLQLSELVPRKSWEVGSCEGERKPTQGFEFYMFLKVENTKVRQLVERTNFSKT